MRRLAIPAALSVIAGALFAGCGSPAPGGPVRNGAAEADRLSVVTSTNVYASVASAIAGDRATVTAILADPSADPHSFEASPTEQAQIAGADLVIANGGGYDDFVAQMVSAASPQPELIDAYQTSGVGKGDTGGADQPPVNEHVFYDLAAMRTVGDAIAAKLGALDPAGAADYAARARSFAAELATLTARAKSLQIGNGTPAVATEPVADYLLELAGVTDVTPRGFADAVEREDDPAPRDVADVVDMFSAGTARLLVVNEQTDGPVIGQITAAATERRVPHLLVTETLPAGVNDYVSWISGTLDRLQAALG